MQDRDTSKINASDSLEKPHTHEKSAHSSHDEKPENKIKAIRTSLYKIAKEEEEEAVSQRVSWQIRQVKSKKEHAQNFLPPKSETASPARHTNSPPRHKNISRRKKSFGIIPRQGDTAGEAVRKCIFLFSMAVFLVCVVLMTLYLADLYRSNHLYTDLGISYHARQPELVTEETDTSQTASDDDAEKVYTLLAGADDLLAINEEVAGWISIADTEVDYPLMQHLADSEGDEYYLYRNIAGEDTKTGSIFLDCRCSFDMVGTDGTLEIENSDNLIIYGHNMRDGSMFGSLKYYMTDDDYYEAHPIITLNSNYETYQYKIFAYFIADAEDETDTRFEYWNGINFADETEFYEYVNEIKRRTLRITNVDVSYGDSLLTLSTCSSVFDTARLVIVARLVREDEDPYDRVVGSTENPNIKWPTAYYLWHENTYDPDAPFVPYG